MASLAPSRRIAVIGGGIAGLAAAHRLLELDPLVRVTIYEASDRLGGSLHTVSRDGFLVEQGADSFITNVPWGVDLCRRIGLGDELIGTNPEERRAFVVRRGRLRPVPDGFVLMAPSRIWPVVTTPILSPLGKLRLAWEYFIPPRASDGDESLASFVRRRLGREAFERLVQPLVAGIYTADPEKLSLAATLPRFQEMERLHGGLIRAALRGNSAPSDGPINHAVDQEPASGARYALFVTPRGGLSSIVSAITARLPAGTVRLNTAVERIVRDGNRWRLSDVEFDAVIVAAPATIASRLLADVDGELATELSAIENAGAVVVSMAFDRQQIRHPLDGFGFVVPAIERRRILSASFSSVKFPGRAPADKALIRTFVGGACQRELVDLSDADLEQFVSEELGDLLGITGQPLWTMIARWSQSMPQYHLGHLDRVARIEARARALPGLALAGNAYRGVGIPQAIHSGEEGAARLLARG
ncbi:MAG TPA: protoporphyrinogen oxidase [Pirellulales bacterium]|jgi:oxygen-dependent protoporphyrinogen oxidase|nr:protoporphyrinogen oxidase [Pirellulales bacterium]